MVRVEDLVDGRVSEVNEILRKSFGARFGGDYDDYDGTPLPRSNELNMIVNRRYLGFHKVVGKFDSKDGSKIRVLPEYSGSAVVYAVTYEEKFGKKVEVIIDPRANAVRMRP